MFLEISPWGLFVTFNLLFYVQKWSPQASQFAHMTKRGTPRFLPFLHLFYSTSHLYSFQSADDMGLGKTLTMISLILAMKMKAKKDKEEMEEKKKDSWLSKTGNKNLLSLTQWIK